MILRFLKRGMLLALLFFVVCPFGFVKAQTPNKCVFQNPFNDGKPFASHIVAGGSIDPQFPGLHNVVAGGWAGVDTQGQYRSVFANGGTVTFAGWDQTGGGFGVIVDGIGVCQGWRMATWHMPDDPSKRLPTGSIIDGATILGIHGHSGSMSANVWSHTHMSLGTKSNPGFPSDPASEWFFIHPERVVLNNVTHVDEKQQQNNANAFGAIQEVAPDSEFGLVTDVVYGSQFGYLDEPVPSVSLPIIIFLVILGLLFFIGLGFILSSRDGRKLVAVFTLLIVICCCPVSLLISNASGQYNDVEKTVATKNQKTLLVVVNAVPVVRSIPIVAKEVSGNIVNPLIWKSIVEAVETEGGTINDALLLYALQRSEAGNAPNGDCKGFETSRACNSIAGAKGPFQFMDGTWPNYAESNWNKWDLYDSARAAYRMFLKLNLLRQQSKPSFQARFSAQDGGSCWNCGFDGYNQAGSVWDTYQVLKMVIK